MVAMSEAAADDYLLCICPICRTRFRASEELLNVAAGQVRCGACLAVFNGRDHLLEPTAAGDGEPRQAPKEERASARAAAADAPPSASAMSLTAPLASILILAAALFANLLWLRFDVWSQQPAWRTVYEDACEFIGCRLRTLRTVADIDVLSSAFATRRGSPDEMELALELRNRAAFAQPFPTLIVRLRDRQGQMLATHRWPPEEYLEPDATLMASGQQTSIVLRFDDPGAQAIDYRLSVL